MPATLIKVEIVRLEPVELITFNGKYTNLCIQELGTAWCDLRYSTMFISLVAGFPLRICRRQLVGISRKGNVQRGQQVDAEDKRRQ
jgi:hypothetical protein